MGDSRWSASSFQPRQTAVAVGDGPGWQTQTSSPTSTWLSSSVLRLLEIGQTRPMPPRRPRQGWWHATGGSSVGGAPCASISTFCPGLGGDATSVSPPMRVRAGGTLARGSRDQVGQRVGATGPGATGFELAPRFRPRLPSVSLRAFIYRRLSVERHQPAPRSRGRCRRWCRCRRAGCRRSRPAGRSCGWRAGPSSSGGSTPGCSRAVPQQV